MSVKSRDGYIGGSPHVCAVIPSGSTTAGMSVRAVGKPTVLPTPLSESKLPKAVLAGRSACLQLQISFILHRAPMACRCTCLKEALSLACACLASHGGFMQTRARGLANAKQDGLMLSCNTYIRSAAAEARRLTDMVELDVCKKYGTNKADFRRLCVWQRVGVGAQTKGIRVEAAEHRRRGGYGQFYHEHYDCDESVRSPAAKAERARVSAAWKALTPEEKAPYAARAEAQEEAVAAAREDSTLPQLQARAATLSSRQSSRLQRAMAQQMLTGIEGHPCWTRGLGLCAAGTALKPAHVNVEGNRGAVHRKLLKHFEYDPVEIKNEGTSIPLRSCHRRYWGICGEAAFAAEACRCTSNLYKLLKGMQITRDDYPVLISLSASVAPCWFLLADTVGKGETAMLTPLDAVADDIFRLRVGEPDPLTGKRLPVVETAQRILRPMLEASGEDQEVIGCAVHHFVPCRHAEAGHACCFKKQALKGTGALRTRSDGFNAPKAAGESDVEKPVKLPFGLSMNVGGRGAGAPEHPPDERSRGRSSAAAGPPDHPKKQENQWSA